MLRLPQYVGCRTRVAVGQIGKYRFYSQVAVEAAHFAQSASVEGAVPTIGPRSFALSPKLSRDSLLSLPLDHHVNPLLEMPKLDILALYKDELNHLSKITPSKAQSDRQFALHITDIILQNLTSDTAQVNRMLRCMKNFPLYNVVVKDIRETIRPLTIKSSIFEFIVDPSSREASLAVREVMHMVLDSSQGNDAKYNSLMSYLQILASSNVVNRNAIKIDKECSQKLRCLLKPENYYQAYSYFFNINMKGKIVNMLTRKLTRGSPRDKFVLRTGWSDPKWHDTLRIDFKPHQIHRMVVFLRFSVAESLAREFIRKRDVVNANLYLGVLVAQLEYISNPDHQFNMNKNRLTAILAKAQTILKVLAAHAITFKGPDSCVDVLRYMINNEIGVSFDMVLTLMRLLRESGNLDEALIIANNTHLEHASDSERLRMVEEMFRMIKLKYPSSPKVLIGYTAAMLTGNSGNPGQNEGLDILNDLFVLGLVFGNGRVEKLSNYDGIPKADVNKRLTGFHFTSQTLASVYELLFASLDPEKLTLEIIHTLYTRYMEMISEYRRASSDGNDSMRIGPFKGRYLNDRIVLVMITHLLLGYDRYDGRSTERYQLAKTIMEDFNSKTNLSSMQRSPEAFSLLLRASLLEHHDPQTAFHLVRYLRSIRYPLKFEHYFPFIKYHFERNEPSHAKVWYDELVRQCTVTTSGDSRELFNIARKLHWEVTGFVYRKTRIHNNYANREALASIRLGQIDHFKPSLEQPRTSDIPEALLPQDSQIKVLQNGAHSTHSDSSHDQGDPQKGHFQQTPTDDASFKSKTRMAHLANLIRISSQPHEEVSSAHLSS